MPVSFQILKNKGLVYVRYEGIAGLDDTMRPFAEYAQHPDCRPGLKQFVDFSAVTEVHMDFPGLMKIQAQKAGVFMNGPAETLIIYLAPSPMTQNLAHSIVRSWEPYPSVVPVVIREEVEAMSILGLSETSIEQLLATAA